MKIHVVKRGEPLWLIGREYGVSVSDIIEANEIEGIPCLTAGQALIIPSGDKDIVDRDSLKGMKLHCSLSHVSRDKYERVMEFMDGTVDYITPEIYSLDNLGDIRNRYAEINFGRSNISFLLRLLQPLGADDIEEEPVIDSIRVNLAGDRFCGVNMELGSIPIDDRWIKAIGRVKDAIGKEGQILIITIDPLEEGRNGSLSGGTLESLIEKGLVDFVILSCGEWGWAEGPPMSPVPIDRLRRAVEYALSFIPPKRLIPTIPLYGLDWRLPYVPGGYPAIRLSHQQAIMLAGKYFAEIHYDRRYSSACFRYTDDSNTEHEVWFEDIRSLKDKLSLLSEIGVGGINLLGGEYSFPQAWRIIKSGK